jgi:hypothetical protein
MGRDSVQSLTLLEGDPIVSWIVAVAFAAALGWAGAADAGGLRITVGQAHGVPQRGRIVQDRGLEVFGERRITVTANPQCRDAAGNWVCGGARPHQHHRTIIVPQPVYVVPSRNCYVPGYWGRTTPEWRCEGTGGYAMLVLRP